MGLYRLKKYEDILGITKNRTNGCIVKQNGWYLRHLGTEFAAIAWGVSRERQNFYRQHFSLKKSSNFLNRFKEPHLSKSRHALR
jgi:hypothetical protein